MSDFFREANEQRRNRGMHGLIEIIEAEWRDKVKAAVLEEREACALMVVPLDESLADAIRARG